MPIPPKSISDMSVGLAGFDLVYKSGPIEFAGGIYKAPNSSKDNTEYDGELVLKAEALAVKALGSIITSKTDPTSLFVFAFVDANIGGPPCFFVTGLSAGFGYNRSLKIPTMDQVSTFPLLAGLNNPAALGLSGSGMPASSELSTVLTKIDAVIQPDPGEYWFAAGVQFTTYELLFSNVMLAIEAGKEFEILLLGKSVASLPPVGVSYAYVELDLEVVLIPDQGLFKAEAILSQNSFLLERACHLTGGFAFFSWFGNNQYAGDFVFTIGGYHPAFKPPSHYPIISRVGFNWIVSSEVLIKGGVYFALTPSCMMAGGSLEALFHSGNLRAWFTAYADMLIYWKPFYFTADIGVDVGVSYHVHFLFVSTTLKLEVGANLYLYGPPTGGRVHVSLWIVSFTVPFGADQNAGDHRINWDEFKKMLPQAKKASQQLVTNTTTSSLLLTNLDQVPLETDIDVCHINISNGLLNQVQEQGVNRWIVRADELTLNIESSVPVTEVQFGQTTIKPSDAQTALNIRPMQVEISSSTNTITVVSLDGNQMMWNVPSKSEKTLPTAMWGKAVSDPSSINSNDRVLPDCLIGVKDLSPMANTDYGNTGPIDISQSFGDVPLLDGGKLPELSLSQSAPVYKNDAQINDNAIASIIAPGITKTTPQRAAIAKALEGLVQFDAGKENLSQFNASNNFSGQPLVGDLPVN
jgi:hypothetical protein